MEALKQMRFSDRIGLTKPNQFIQYDSMNKPLRNHLWNALHMFYWSKSSHSYMIYFGERNRIAYLLEDIWNRYFNYKIDNLSNKVNDNIKVISDYFSECNWYEVYNFLEFVLEEKDKADELYGLLKASCSNMKKVLLSNSAMVNNDAESNRWHVNGNIEIEIDEL